MEEKEEQIIELKNKFNNLLAAYKDIQTSGAPERIALAWRWGSSTIILNKADGDSISSLVESIVQKELTALEAEIKLLENG